MPIPLLPRSGAGYQGCHDYPCRNPICHLVEVAAAVMWQWLTVTGRITVIMRMAMNTREFPLKPVLAD